jgi:PAS domain S-box-containing protein
MRRRTQIVLTVTFMVALLVTAFSYIYITQMLRQRIKTARDTADNVCAQLAFVATSAVPDLTSTKVDTNKPDAVRKGIAYYLGTDRDLNVLLESVTGNWPDVLDAAVVDADGKAILHSNPDLVGKLIPVRAAFQTMQDARFRRQLRMVYNTPTVYEVRRPLQLNGAPFGSVRVGVSTVFLKHDLTPWLQHAVILSGIAILLSLVIAAGLSRLALGPLERIAQSLDNVSYGDSEPVPEEGAPEGATLDEYGLVTLKIAHLGRQMRDAKEIFSALKSNVDQIMSNLQDGLMLFTREARVVLVSASVETFLGRPRHELLGQNVKHIFSSESNLGSVVLDAFRLQHPIEEQEIDAPNGKQVKISLDFIQERGTQMGALGALLTMRDAESARQIEDEIEMSRRMSASGRLTRGVAHEVKNPINAIVLHLQLLQTKLKQTDPETRRHMDIIDSEIHRLDRVVQILVDFTRPRDLHLEEIDLRRLLDDVLSLAAPDAGQHAVKLVRQFPAEPLLVKVDSDLMKQTILNIVLNGVQSMEKGGTLTTSTRREDNMIVTEIRDQGSGIPTELHDKVFELYFTTKKDGSGMGLAHAFQTAQWHHGSLDFESAIGKGTVFRLRLPLVGTKSSAPKEVVVT